MATIGVPKMQRLWITVPGLSMKQDFKAARQRLMNDFPTIDEVIATTAPGTVLILASDPIDVNAWRETLRSISTAQARTGRFRLAPRGHDHHDHAA
jgi:hypothetical protein